MSNPHDGHRARMRQRYFQTGLDGFQSHEILEMLLFYSFRQGDTNALAHKLLSHFGSLPAVFNASKEELMQVDGIGEQSAMLITMIPQLERRYRLELSEMPKIYDNSAACAEYLISYFTGKKDEEIVVMLFDSFCHLLKFESVSCRATNSHVYVDFRKLTKDILQLNVSCLVVAHNHPGGPALPSNSDVQLTVSLRDYLAMYDVMLADHIIVGEDGYTSMCLSKNYSGIFATKAIASLQRSCEIMKKHKSAIEKANKKEAESGKGKNTDKHPKSVKNKSQDKSKTKAKSDT